MFSISLADKLLRKTISFAAGLEEGVEPLADLIPPETGNKTAERIWKVFKAASGTEEYSFSKDEETLEESYLTARQSFLDYYQRFPAQAEHYLRLLSEANTKEERARSVAYAWTPELAMNEKDILQRWRLTKVKPNPEPILATEVMIQLNALYTLPDPGKSRIPPHLAPPWEALRHEPGEAIADYDHPVPLFHTESHELIDCLDELDEDLAFEKQQGILPPHYKVPILVSVSVTHPNIDSITGDWVKHLIANKNYRNMEIFILTEHGCRTICSTLFGADFPLFTVLGAYGAHFNALKYAQLIFSKSHGIRAGFKLDTDEGIRSRDLFKARGKTWFQVMCHEYWGGSARDWKGRKVLLGINEGEYINSKDIQRLGYAESLRQPDVMVPKSHSGPDLFFSKGFAHGRATALYNRFNFLEDFLSHPVVKGGGYGITNQALRQATPFTLSVVGRAEDQQFYFSGLSRGIRGIFHPDLRIAHYKDRVAASEGKTAATRFAGDMFRLVLFGHLAEVLGVKEDIDPMPGVFASVLAPAQSFFHILTHAYHYCRKNDDAAADYLLGTVLKRLQTLRSDIKNGTIQRLLKEEENGWRRFTDMSLKLDPEETKKAIEKLSIN